MKEVMATQRSSSASTLCVHTVQIWLLMGKKLFFFFFFSVINIYWWKIYIFYLSAWIIASKERMFWKWIISNSFWRIFILLFVYLFLIQLCLLFSGTLVSWKFSDMMELKKVCGCIAWSIVDQDGVTNVHIQIGQSLANGTYQLRGKNQKKEGKSRGKKCLFGKIRWLTIVGSTCKHVLKKRKILASSLAFETLFKQIIEQ